jgi:hypothetical protein
MRGSRACKRPPVIVHSRNRLPKKVTYPLQPYQPTGAYAGAKDPSPSVKDTSQILEEELGNQYDMNFTEPTDSSWLSDAFVESSDSDWSDDSDNDTQVEENQDNENIPVEPYTKRLRKKADRRKSVDRDMKERSHWLNEIERIRQATIERQYFYTQECHQSDCHLSGEWSCYDCNLGKEFFQIA